MDKLEKNIKKLLWANTLMSTQVQAVVGTIFLLAKGFTLAQVMFFGSIYAVGALLSEIPTGAFSDRIGRRQSLILSLLIEIPVTIFVIISNSYLVLAVMFLIFGVSSSFRSGTDSAILYDTLKDLNKENDFKIINGRMKWMGAWGGAIGGIAGGLLAKYNLSFPWWAWVGVMLAVLYVFISLVEPREHKGKNSISQLAHLKKSLAISFTGEATYFIFYYVFVWLFFWIGYSLWQVYLKQIGLPVEYFGFVYAGASLLSGFSSKVSHKTEKFFGMKNALFFIPLALALVFSLEARFMLIFSFVFIGAQSLIGGFFGPILEDYVNSRIQSETRATVLSIQNMFSRLSFILMSPIIGYIADLYSLNIALYIMSAILVALSFVFLSAYKKKSLTVSYNKEFAE